MPDLQTRIAATSALFLFILAIPYNPMDAQAQSALPPNEQVGPICVGERHHVEIDTVSVDLNRTCVTITVKDPDSGSGVDAETLDGLDSTQFLRNDVAGTLSGSLTVTGVLAVGGEVTVGSSGMTCTATKEGAQRYDSSAKALQFCDGTSWRAVGPPAGAVEAFDLATCPSGWTAYTAAIDRNIIGVGTHTLGQTGGEASHTMTVAELVPHTHSIIFNIHGAADGGNGDYGPGTGRTDGTTSTGGGAAFNVLDPYVALLYCKKL